MAPDKLILALDVPDDQIALAWVDRLGPHIGCFKIGLQLFCRFGPNLVREIQARGATVFLDLKLHDIPNTVARAIDSLAPLAPAYLTLHALGGPEMIAAARRAAPPSTRLLAVTILTSHTPESLPALGLRDPLPDLVQTLGTLSVNAGADGLVCSPHEVGVLRHALGDAPHLITPGVRPPGSALGDQARVATPQFAIDQGATAVVIGRPVLEAADPVALLTSL